MGSNRFFTITRLVGLLLMVVFSLKFADSVVRGIASLKRETIAKETTKDVEEKTEPEAEKAKKAKKFSPETFAVASTLIRPEHSPVNVLLKYHYLEGALAEAICNIHKPPPDRLS